MDNKQLSILINSYKNQAQPQQIESLKQIVDYGINTLNIPLASKYIEELIALEPDNLAYIYKRAEILVFIDPDKAFKDIKLLEKEVIDPIKLKLLKQQYYFSIEDYKKTEKSFVPSIVDSLMYKQFAIALRTNSKLTFKSHPNLENNFEFFQYITSKLDYFKLHKLLRDWYYFGKKKFTKKEEQGFLHNLKIRVDINNRKFDKIDIIDITNCNDEIKKCYYQSIGDFKSYWAIRNRQASTTVNIASSFNIPTLPNIDKLSDGSKLLIVSSEGFGDNIMSIRYIKEFINQNLNISITLLVYKELIDLFKEIITEPNITFLTYLDESDHNRLYGMNHDYLIYLSEIMFFANIYTIDDIKSSQLKYPLYDRSKLGNNILVHWKTSPRNIDTRQRSLELSKLLSYVDLSEDSIITVQPDINDKELELLRKYNIKVIDVDSFYDTYELLKSCKKVYTNDTAMLHLAGGMDIDTVMVLNRFIDCKFYYKSSDDTNRHYLYNYLEVIY
jgi:hypothetical protein